MLYEKVNALCKAHGTNLTKLEKECGLANATIRRWKTGSPSAESLRRVADYFCVSVDYLLGRNVYVVLSEDAQKYVKEFEALSEDKKQLAMAYMAVVKAQ